MDIRILASGSTGNCYYVSDGVTSLLIECGIPWKKIQQALNFETSKIAACLISHEHQDHAKAVKDVMKAGIDCWASVGTFKALGLEGHRTMQLGFNPYWTLDSWDILGFTLKHDALGPLGFLLSSRTTGVRLMYATDTAFIRYKFQNLTHIMVECNYSLDFLRNSTVSGDLHPAVKRRIMRNHFSLENVKTMLLANDLSKVQVIYLLHLSRNNSDAKLFKTQIQEATGKMVVVA
jgi:phosphoribosyl 1,2-cyclic phosphodiesterase